MRLARQRGLNKPYEWLDYYESHTRYEWALQVALDTIQPCGERRDDLRIAWQAAALIASNRTERMSESELKNTANAIASYLWIMNPPEEI